MIEHITEYPYYTTQRLIAGLQAGGVFVTTHNNAIEIEDLLDLLKLGLVTREIVSVDVSKWRWIGAKPNEHDRIA